MRNAFTLAFMGTAAAFILLGNFLANHADPISGKMAPPSTIVHLILVGIMSLVVGILFYEITGREVR